MIELSYATKVSIGFEYVLEMLKPVSCYGTEKSRRLKPATPDEKLLLLREFDNIERIIESYEVCKNEIGTMLRMMSHFKDIRKSLERDANYCFDEVELFELKNFLLQYQQLYLVFLKFTTICRLDGFEFVDMEDALDILDPDHKRIPSFYISESYSDELREIRKEKKNIEAELRSEENQNRKEQLQTLRLRVVVREEAEEGRIRKEITTKLRSYLSVMQQHIKLMADLDVLLCKARLAIENDCVRPEITSGEMYFENMIHPQIRDVLKEKSKNFTPVTISLNHGASVITGANMGGKSVALKTAALNVMLVLCGFYPFAQCAGVPMFEEIHFVAEDKQSVEQGLSSFGAEIMQLDHVVKASQRAFCLIILDEFARGTNPDEGAVIVQAVTKFFNAQNSITLLTTHYDNVAEFANAHYQVIGLKGADAQNLKQEITASVAISGVDIIARHMNYGLYRVYGKSDCPRDALNICRMLALDEKVLSIIEKNYM